MGTLSQMRRGISLLGIVMLVAILGAAAARADGGGSSESTTTETTTTTATTTTTLSTTTTPVYVPLAGTSLPQSCVGAGVAAIASGNGAVIAVELSSSLGASEYSASNPYLTLDAATRTGSGCTNSHVALTNVSLFGGAVTAATVTATGGKGKATALAVNGAPVSATAGQTIAVGSWGLLTLGASSGRLSAPLALRLRSSHNSVPAGTTIFIGFAATAEQRTVTPPPKPPVNNHPHHHHHHHHVGGHGHKSRVPQPLTWTPKLGISSSAYVFPVDNGASYADTYGAGRNDIYDGWHHGDDLFAPLGTPLVAVATGNLALVGWNELGGWRVWLTDEMGNSFYYAHMAGYSSWILHHHHVHAGQVLGFLGRTGDAFPTPPHLHFEIHPHQLVKLGYDGAVNPTPYLQSWRVVHLTPSQIPSAARLVAPAGSPSQEAAVVWDELLEARGLGPDGEPAVAQTPSVRRPFPAAWNTPEFVDARRLASSRRSGDSPLSSDAPWPSVGLGLGLAALVALGSFAFLRRRRSAA